MSRKFIHYDIDKMFNTEDRKPNWYYGIYKINMLVAGGSGAGKSWFVLDNILNNVFFEEDDAALLCLFLPQETYESGFWDGFIRDYKTKHDLQNVNIVVFDISRGKTFRDLSVNQTIHDNIPVVDGFPDLDILKELKKDIDKKTKAKHKIVCLFDDFISNFTRQDWAKYYRYLFNISRLSGSTVSCVQSIDRIPPAVRGSYTIIVIFGFSISESQVRPMIKNFISLGLTKQQTDLLIQLSSSADARKGHKPLILIGGTAPAGKNIMYDGEFVDV